MSESTLTPAMTRTLRAVRRGAYWPLLFIGVFISNLAGPVLGSALACGLVEVAVVAALALTVFMPLTAFFIWRGRL